MALVRFTPSQLPLEQAFGTFDHVKGRRALFEVCGYPANSDQRFRARRCCTGELRGWSSMQSHWISRQAHGVKAFARCRCSGIYVAHGAILVAVANDL